MSRTRWVLVPIAGLSLAAGVAVAGPQSSETTPFTADFQAGVVKQKQRACDASHTAFRSSSRAPRRAVTRASPAT